MSGFDVRYASVCPSDIRGRLIRNPNYGGPSVGPHGWTWREEVSKNHGAKPEFHKALRESIRESGVRNPVLLYCFEDGGLFLTFGGSRVSAAIDVGLTEIPAIINDYSGAYKDEPAVTPENVQSFFTDTPRDIHFGETGFDYHYNLERARRHDHDPSGLNWLDTKPNWLYEEFPWLLNQNS